MACKVLGESGEDDRIADDTSAQMATAAASAEVDSNDEDSEMDLLTKDDMKEEITCDNIHLDAPKVTTPLEGI